MPRCYCSGPGWHTHASHDPDLSPWLADNAKPTAATWRCAARFSIDDEIQPGHNLPAPVKTTAFIGYTKQALWLHFVALDPHPADILVKYRHHDGFANNDEYAGIIFSPLNDTQWGYEFFCSTGATEVDEFRQQGTEYSSFDAIRYCATKLTRHGYTVTMKIPFRSLKFPHSDRPQAWRLVLFRNWARNIRHQIINIKINYNSNSHRTFTRFQLALERRRGRCAVCGKRSGQNGQASWRRLAVDSSGLHIPGANEKAYRQPGISDRRLAQTRLLLSSFFLS